MFDLDARPGSTAVIGSEVMELMWPEKGRVDDWRAALNVVENLDRRSHSNWVVMEMKNLGETIADFVT